MTRKKMMATCLAAAAVGILFVSRAPFRAAAEPAPKLSARVFELRTYHCNPGKLDELHARFRNHTNYLFVKHGMTLVGYWTPADGPDAENTLIYLLAHDSREAADKSWKAFMADPEWQKVFAESQANGSLTSKVESKFLNPTDYSPLR